MASAGKRGVDPVSYIKMVFIFAGVALLNRTRKQVFHGLGPDGAPPGSAKSLAWWSLICWLGAITSGRLLAYL